MNTNNKPLSDGKSNSLSFRLLCQRLDKVKTKSGRYEKYKCIFNEDIDRQFRLSGDNSLFPIMRLICPALDRLRIYRIKVSYSQRRERIMSIILSL